MFRAKTVLVLGAGASCEVGLPQGAELLTTIVKLLGFRFDHFGVLTQGDHLILDALKLKLKEGREVRLLNEHLLAAVQMVKSANQAISIDNVIDALEDERVETVGKLAISRVILSSESSSRFFRNEDGNPGIHLPRFKSTWYSSLTKILTEGVKKSQIESIFDNIEIVNFNYDRCLEHYLRHSIGEYYGVPHRDLSSLVDSLKIYRPYGRVGKLPWQGGRDPAIEFGRCGVEEISSSSDLLMTFTEQIEDGAIVDSIKLAMGKADRVIFLGFAFHRQNLELLSVGRARCPDVLASALKISSGDRDVISTEIASQFSDGSFDDIRSVQLADLTCADLFSEYWRTITAEAS